MDEALKAKYRKYQNNLLVGGKVIIFFGIWSMIKFLMFVFLDREDFLSMLNFSNADMNYLYLYIVMISILFVLDIILRFYVGLNVVKTGKTQKQSVLCMLILVVMIAFSVFCIVSGLFGSGYELSKADTYITAIVDMTGLYNLCEVMYSYVSLLRLSRMNVVKE